MLVNVLRPLTEKKQRWKLNVKTGLLPEFNIMMLTISVHMSKIDSSVSYLRTESCGPT